MQKNVLYHRLHIVMVDIKTIIHSISGQMLAETQVYNSLISLTSISADWCTQEPAEDIANSGQKESATVQRRRAARST